MVRIFTLSLFLSLLAHSAKPVSIEEPFYSGNGCSDKNVYSFSKNSFNQFDVGLFDYFINVPGSIKGLQIRKTCKITIPIHVPIGYRIAINPLAWEGSVNLPSESSVVWFAEYSFDGFAAPSFKRRWKGPVQKNFNFSDKETGLETVWSACGSDTTLTINTVLYMRQFSPSEEAHISFDRLSSSKIQGLFRQKEC